MKQASLSLVMIIRDEAAHLKECILAIRDLADEIIILDSGSSDDSVRIAGSLGAKVYHHTDWQGYGVQRQRAQSYARCDYILALDADERITPTLKQSISHVLEQPVSGQDVYALQRLNYFCNVPVHGYGGYRDSIVRLYSRTAFQYSALKVHESVVTDNANINKLEGDLIHYVCRDFYHFLHKNLRYCVDWAVDQKKAGKQGYMIKGTVNALFAFFREYVLRGAILGGTYGFLLAMGSAHYTFNKYLVLSHLNAMDCDPC